MSRGLKILARELEVPVVALSQLSRNLQERTATSGRMLSDLRESGCLHRGHHGVLRADTGAEVTLGELLRERQRQPCRSGRSTSSAGWFPRRSPTSSPSGTKEVYRLRLASGREVKASGNHRFLTLDGWQPLEELAVGGRLGIPRRNPEPARSRSWLVGAQSWVCWPISSATAAFCAASPCITRPTTRRTWLSWRPPRPPSSGSHPGAWPRRPGGTSYLPAPYHCTHGRLNPLARLVPRARHRRSALP